MLFARKTTPNQFYIVDVIITGRCYIGGMVMRFIVFTGLPGTDKSSAAAFGRRIDCSFAKNHPETTLLHSEINPKRTAEENLGYAGHELWAVKGSW